MPDVESYLDQVCGRLPLDPALAAEIREELCGHLQELVAASRAAGLGSAEAAAQAVARFGAARRVSLSLDEVHRPACVWARRLQGAAAGALLGCLLGLLCPLVGRLGPLSALAAPLLSARHVLPVLDGAFTGAFVGALAATQGGLFAGWLLGSLLWLLASTICWVTGTLTDSYLPEQSLAAFDGLLLAPVIGGLFSAAVGLGAAALVSLTSRPRPVIR